MAMPTLDVINDKAKTHFRNFYAALVNRGVSPAEAKRRTEVEFGPGALDDLSTQESATDAGLATLPATTLDQYKKEPAAPATKEPPIPGGPTPPPSLGPATTPPPGALPVPMVPPLAQAPPQAPGALPGPGGQFSPGIGAPGAAPKPVVSQVGMGMTPPAPTSGPSAPGATAPPEIQTDSDGKSNWFAMLAPMIAPALGAAFGGKMGFATGMQAAGGFAEGMAEGKIRQQKFGLEKEKLATEKAHQTTMEGLETRRVASTEAATKSSIETNEGQRRTNELLQIKATQDIRKTELERMLQTDSPARSGNATVDADLNLYRGTPQYQIDLKLAQEAKTTAAKKDLFEAISAEREAEFRGAQIAALKLANVDRLRGIRDDPFGPPVERLAAAKELGTPETIEDLRDRDTKSLTSSLLKTISDSISRYGSPLSFEQMLSPIQKAVKEMLGGEIKEELNPDIQKAIEKIKLDGGSLDQLRKVLAAGITMSNGNKIPLTPAQILLAEKAYSLAPGPPQVVRPAAERAGAMVRETIGRFPDIIPTLSGDIPAVQRGFQQLVGKGISSAYRPVATRLNQFEEGFRRGLFPLGSTAPDTAKVNAARSILNSPQR